jgi:hypothetical protein
MALTIKKKVGSIQMLNARDPHPLVQEALKKGFDLNEGILVMYQHQYYFADEAMQLLAILSRPDDRFNKLNQCIFKYRWVAKSSYPLFKMLRNTLLRIRGVSKMPTNPHPLFEQLPAVLKKRYANRIYSEDKVVLSGHLDVTFSTFFKRLSFFARLMGALATYAEKNITTHVMIKSKKKSKKIFMQRTLVLNNKKTIRFYSKFIYPKHNQMFEYTRSLFGWRATYELKENTLIMKHHSWGIYCFGLIIPMPVGFLLGRCYAEDIALSDHQFSMMMKVEHPLLGELYRYSGKFML